VNPPLRDDRALVTAWITSSDQGAFAELVSRHGGLMRRSALVALGTAARRDPGLVDDAVQEASARLLGALRAYKGDSSPATFFAAVARRSALDELRKGLRHRARLERAVRLGEAPGSADPAGGDPAVSAERMAAAERVIGTLSRLPEPERSLVYLRDAEGMDVGSLAAVFGMPEGTVKSKLARARAKIRQRVLREWGDV
jgi:RNA polymerase sigma-70 factor (ECF subfamily)